MSKVLANIFRFTVGLLFVFSGFVKITDPAGTAIKLTDYFEVFADKFFSGFELLIPMAMFLSVLITTFEILLGLSLLLLFRIRITTSWLLLLIVFFTVLTGYSHFTGEVTDCGCFGDAIPLTPKQSFLKDIVFLFPPILFLFWYRKKFKSSFDNRVGVIIMGIGLVSCLSYAYYNIAHLPAIDFRSFKVGNDVKSLTSDGTPAVYAYVFEKDGKKVALESFTTDPTYKYLNEYNVKKEAEPPTINDFIVNSLDGDDLTPYVLEGKTLIVVFQNLEEVSDEQVSLVNDLLDGFPKDYERFVMFGGDEVIAKEKKLKGELVTLDQTVRKAMVRSNPGILIFENGVVQGKWHINDIDEVNIGL